MDNSKYIQYLSRGARVLFIGQDRHAKNGQQCTVLYTVPNPSGYAENQWYDVRFDDGAMGRFPGRYLVQADGKETAA